MTSPFPGWIWQAPAHWSRIAAVDMHTCGEPLRVFTAGLPPIKGDTVLEKRRYFREHYDHLRTGAMWEPRGHADMYGAVITPSRDADFDVFFLHNEGYSTMCGHGIIALTTLVIEAGLLQRQAEGGDVAVTFSVPAGIIRACATVKDGRARQVSFRNVPSFVYLKDCEIKVPGIGRLNISVAYGGAFYALVDAGPLGLQLVPAEFNRLVDYGRRIKRAVMNEFTIEHPFEPELSFLYGTIVVGPAREDRHHSRNVCIFAEGELDRSPTGSGVSARVALHHANGELAAGESITIESIIGSTMTVRVVEQTRFGPHEAVVPEVSGSAFTTGRNELYFDPDDPFAGGFIFR